MLLQRLSCCRGAAMQAALGSEQFKGGRYDLAYETYSQAIALSDDSSSQSILLLNRAACGLKLLRYDAVRRDCDAALSIIPENGKAYLRRAAAMEGCGEYELALEDVTRALELLKNDDKGVRQGIEIRSRLLEMIRLDEAARKKEKQPSSYITSSQTLRLCFGSEHQRTVQLNTPLEFKLFLANELGLWNEALLGTDIVIRDIRVTCECLVLRTLYQNDQGDVTAETNATITASITGGIFSRNGRATVCLTLAMETDTAPQGALVVMRFTCLGPDGAPFNILPVLSLPTHLEIATRGTLSIPRVIIDALAVGAAVYPQCIREVSHAEDKSYVFECPGYISIGGKIWDATFILLNYLCENRHLVKDKVILELGCGTGVLSLALSALQPRQVWMSDLAELLPLVEANLALNQLLVNSTTTALQQYRVQEYVWGEWDEETAARVADVELIIASDVVYDADHFDELLQAMHDLLGTSKRQSVIEVLDAPVFERVLLLAYRKRNEDEAKFFDMLLAQTEFHVTELFVEKKHTTRLQDIKLLRVVVKGS